MIALLLPLLPLPFATPLQSGKQSLRTVALLFSLTLLSACQSIAPPADENPNWTQLRNQLEALEDWQLRGRVNVQYDNESYTPRIIWQQQQEYYRIRLWGTFNAGNTLINGQPGNVIMESDGETFTASSPESLILQQLGYELPVSYLEYWVRGLPAPGSRAQTTFNTENHLTQLQQDGWTVIYTDPRQYGSVSLPRRVEVTRLRNDVRLRFVGLDWTLAGDEDFEAFELAETND
ncbi:MAG: lipoprotein insertase outer membrane protein LolB [Gammaproteobacteria bacterium]